MINCCVIGAGSHSRVQHGAPLARFAADHPGTVRPAAVCDLDEEKARSYAEAFGFERVYRDFRRMVEREKPDAIIAVTPLEITMELGIELLGLGIPLLLEKPPGRTVAEATRLAEAAEATGTPHMVSFNRRFSPALAEARRILAAPHAGDGGATSLEAPSHIIARMFRVRRREHTFITGTGIHLIDATLSFLGRVEEIASRRFDTKDGGEGATVQLRGAEMDASLLIAPDSGTMAETYEIVGPDYTIFADVQAPRLTFTRSGIVESDIRFDGEPDFVANGAYAETAAFLAAVAAGGPFRPTLADGLESMKVAEAIDRGLDTRRQP